MNSSPEEALFQLALAKPVDKRPAFLDAMCEGDTALRARLEALLAAHDQQSGFLPDDQSTESVATLLDESTFTEGSGTQIGRYKLLEKLGEGGFGSVWAAEQKEPVRRRVALKIIKLGMDTKQVVARFEAERQALAMMDHPNISKVLDAGATETGRPYFVMELVKGIAITKYCEQEKLDTHARLDLFIKVCQAIQHAHQKGIIHRDIKPSNIMVTLHDGVPVPKVIDFGIAKATQQELTEKTIYTQYSQFIGTPAYMSPEQAEMSGLDIDTRSDIYSLGVLLYELLTGSTPFDSKELMQSGLDEMRKIIREREPVRPSTRLSKTNVADEVTRLSPNEREDRASSRRLLPQIPSDLDWIVMKCLEKDRSRRYETANGLAADIHRHLDNEPIVARPPSAAYRFQKAWRRNKLAYGGALIVSATIFGAAVVSGVFAVREHSARQSESTERLKAVEAEQKAIAAAEHNLRLSYLSDVNLAHQIFQSGDLARATSLLERYIPTDEAGQQDLRGFEWYYLWSHSKGRSARVVPHQGFVQVTFSPNGRAIATGGSDGVLRVFDRATLAQKTEFGIHPDPLEQYQTIHPVYSPRGTILAGLHRGLYRDDSGTLILCDVEKGTTWSLASGSTNSIVQIAFHEDGDVLIAAERNGTISQWDVMSGQPLGKTRQLAQNASWHRAAFSPDLKLLAVGARKAIPSSAGVSQDEYIEVQVYDLETGNVRSTFATTEIELGELRFTEGNRFLACTGPRSPGRLLIWDVESGREIVNETDMRSFWPIATVSADEFAVGATDSILFVRPGSNEKLERWSGIPGLVHGLAASPDGKQIASAGWDGIVRLWDLPRRENPVTLNLDETATRNLCFSPSGRLMAAANQDAVVIWDSESFDVVHVLDGQRHPVFSPSDGRLATITVSGDSIHFWDSQSGQPDGPPISMEGDRIEQIAFSKDGTLIGCSDAGGQVTLLEVATRRIKQRINMSSDAGRRYLAFGTNSQGENLLAIPVGQRTVKLVNLASGVEHILEGSTPDIWGVVFSPDGRRMASTGNGTIVWNTETGHRELVIEDLTSAVEQISFAPDGKSLLVSIWGGGLGLWDLASGREKIRFLSQNDQSVQSATFSPDGNQIIAGINNTKLMVWTATPSIPND